MIALASTNTYYDDLRMIVIVCVIRRLVLLCSGGTNNDFKLLQANLLLLVLGFSPVEYKKLQIYKNLLKIFK